MKQSYSFTGSSIDNDNVSVIKTRLKPEKLDAIKDSILQRKENVETQGNAIMTSVLFSILQENGFLLTDRIRSELCARYESKGRVPIKSIMRLIAHALAEYPDVLNENFNSDYIDAFVALGGAPDTTGTISTDNFKHVLTEFGLLVDIDELLLSNGISGDEISYELFCNIFDKPIFDDNKSLHSYFSMSGARNGGRGGFERTFGDFEKFMNQHPDFFRQF